MNKKIIFALAALAMFLGVDCKDDPPVKPEPPEKKITLTLQDTTCTEAWLQLQFANFTAPHSYKIYRDTTLAFAGMLFANDTVLIDTALLPQRQYSYKVFRLESNVAKDSSAALQVKTMDTTSQNFVWTIDTLGDGAGSGINDVWIFDENNILVVGALGKKDSNGNYENEYYGFATWNGQQWNIFKVRMDYLGILNISLTPEGLFFISPNQFWFSGGGLAVNWTKDSTEGKPYYLNSTPGFPNPIWNDQEMRSKAIWGRSNRDLYIVGTKGAIGYYDGTAWKNIESNTELDVYGIWGDKDEVLCVASNFTFGTDKQLIRIENFSVKQESVTGAGSGLLDIWFQSGRRYYVVGNGIYEKKFSVRDSLAWKRVGKDELGIYHLNSINGQNINDIVTSGAFGQIGHFNGVRWKGFISQTGINGNWNSVRMKNDIVVAVGWLSNQRAVVLRGKRIQ